MQSQTLALAQRSQQQQVLLWQGVQSSHLPAFCCVPEVRALLSKALLLNYLLSQLTVFISHLLLVFQQWMEVLQSTTVEFRKGWVP